MNTTFTKFIDIFGRSQIIIDERIQRKYEWASMKIIGLIDYINESALSYKENYAANDCKKDIGTMLFFEVPMEERKNYMKISNYGDEGNQRLWSIVIIGKAMYIATKSYSIDNGEQEVLTAHNKVLLDIFLKNVKNNFIPEEQKDVFDYLMNLIAHRFQRKREHKRLPAGVSRKLILCASSHVHFERPFPSSFRSSLYHFRVFIISHRAPSKQW